MIVVNISHSLNVLKLYSWLFIFFSWAISITFKPYTTIYFAKSKKKNIKLY